MFQRYVLLSENWIPYKWMPAYCVYRLAIPTKLVDNELSSCDNNTNK